jgi:hypothetical protein
MNDTLTLNEGNDQKLKTCYQNHGYTNGLIKRRSKGKNWRRIPEPIITQVEIRPIEHVIDLDADPYVPAGWDVAEHQKGGQWKWNQTLLYLCEKKLYRGVVSDRYIHEELVKKTLANGNLLDYIIKPENQYLIPDDWKKDENGNIRYIYLWGTIYRVRSRCFCVRYFFWDDSGMWVWNYCLIDYGRSYHNTDLVLIG